MNEQAEFPDKFGFHELYTTSLVKAEVHTEAVKRVAETFGANILRTHSLVVTVPSLVRMITVANRATTYANVAVSGKPFISDAEIAAAGKSGDWQNAMAEYSLKEYIKTDAARHLCEGEYTTAKFLNGMPDDAVHVLALKALFSSILVQTWTAFEILAGDLFHSVVDAYPESYGARKGSSFNKKYIRENVRSSRKISVHANDDDVDVGNGDKLESPRIYSRLLRIGVW